MTISTGMRTSRKPSAVNPPPSAGAMANTARTRERDTTRRSAAVTRARLLVGLQNVEPLVRLGELVLGLAGEITSP
jgi:hypothetical protein